MIYFQDNRFNSLTDAALELIDPTPNIHTLFVQFNAQFFWNTLDSVEVKWSNRMTRYCFLRITCYYIYIFICICYKQ